MSLTPEQREAQRIYSLAKYYRRKRWIDIWKVGNGCAECGYNTHPAALDFDHIDPSTKKFLIPRNMNANLKRLIAEVRKCRILCANCHRIHSNKQWKSGITYKPNPRKIEDVEVRA